jgi:hypothetical protein
MLHIMRLLHLLVSCQGYDEIFNRFNNKKCVENNIHAFKFGETEIVRSKILRFIVNILEAKH